ncbi:MAG: hypothetical protein ABIT76_08790 [Chthoniobacterales bacterium]
MNPPLLFPESVGKEKKLKKGERRASEPVLVISLYRRRLSAIYQARVRFKEDLLRISTRTRNKTAAQEFARLLYRQCERDIAANKGVLRKPQPPEPHTGESR